MNQIKESVIFQGRELSIATGRYANRLTVRYGALTAEQSSLQQLSHQKRMFLKISISSLLLLIILKNSTPQGNFRADSLKESLSRALLKSSLQGL